MPVQPGTRLGPYEILAALGAGGAGEVFRARDTRLGREVALKVVPEQAALAEARTAAALRHPGIAAVFDVGVEGGVAYIVSELVDGRTLRQVLDDGPMAERRAVEVGAQMAEALAAAHAAGIAHRDLKPENVMLDDAGEVKILDLGLAGEWAAGAAAGTAATDQVTHEGAIRGTVGYMSPEQARGRAADPRGDLFAFGAVLYEMLCGRRAFAGESTADTLSAILKDEPGELPETVGPVLRQVVWRCLEKDPRRRFQSAADLAFVLRTLALPEPRAPAGAAPPQRDWALVVLAGACAAIAAGTLFLKPADQPVYDLTPLTAFTGAETHPSLSPDGRQLAFVWAGEPPGPPGIYVKQIDGGTPLRISPPDLASDYPCWSPDRGRIAYIRAGAGRASVFVVPAMGGPERRLVQYAGDAAPLDWSPDGRWIATSQREGDVGSLFLVSSSTGERRRLTTAPARTYDHNPAFSPDGKMLAFVRIASAIGNRVYRVGIKADGAPDGAPRPVVERDWNTRSVDWMADGKRIVVPSMNGPRVEFWSIPVHGGEARRLPLEFSNDSLTTADAQISIHANRMAVVQSSYELDIGRVECGARGPCAAAAFYGSSRTDSEPQVSADGKRLVFTSTRSGYREIWTSDPDGSGAFQATNFAGLRVGSPRWSPDGQTIAFDAYRAGNSDIWTVSADGGGPRRLTTEATNEFRPSFSRDGQWIYFGSNRGTAEVWKMPAGGGAAQQVTAHGGYEGFESADGKWLYYTKRGRVREGVFRMPAAGGAEQVVAQDTAARAWAVAGNRLYLGLEEPAAIVAVDLSTGRREELYRFPADSHRWNFSTSLAVSPDGRFLYHSGTRRNESDILLVDNFR